MTSTPPPPNPTLIEALANFNANPSLGKSAVINALLESNVILMLEDDPNPNDPNPELKFLVEVDSGQTNVLAFTDLEAVAASYGDAEVHWAALSAREVMSMAIHENFSNFIVNPGGPEGVVLSRRELEQAAVEGKLHAPATQPVESGTEAEIGMPDIRPSPRALAALQKAVEGQGVTEAYWFYISMNKRPPHLGVAFLPWNDAIQGQVGRAVSIAWNTYNPRQSDFSLFPLEGDLSAHARQYGEKLV